jgi:lysylphosphatidylglycerol synthetase-like protein (DUF2156 family)
MERNIFKIKKAFVIPFIMIIVLLFLLLLLSLFAGQPWEKIFLVFAFTATLLVGIEAAKREIVVTRESLIIKKFFRSKSFSWTDITQLAVVELRNKVYFLLTTTKGFYFFSNFYENHPLLIRSIMDRLAPEKVEVEVRNYLDRPVERRSQIIFCWITAAMIAAFIILKLLV